MKAMEHEPRAGDQAAAVEVRPVLASGAQDKLSARLYVPPVPLEARDPNALHAPRHPPRDGRTAAHGLIVLYPCGGFVSVEMDQADGFVRALAARTGYLVLVASYTTSAIRPFPAAAEDAYAVLNWAQRHRARLGWNGARMLCAGIEAGGNLAAVAALMARDRGGPALGGQILVMPMLDPGLTSCSMRGTTSRRAADACASAYRDYLPHALDRTHPYACPLQASRMKGLPPALLITAEDDPLRDEAELYGGKLLAAGIATRVRRLPPIDANDPEARCNGARKENALQEIAAFVASLEMPAQASQQEA